MGRRGSAYIYFFAFVFVFAFAFVLACLASICMLLHPTACHCIIFIPPLFCFAPVFFTLFGVRLFCPVNIVRYEIECNRLSSRKFLRLASLAVLQQRPE